MEKICFSLFLKNKLTFSALIFFSIFVFITGRKTTRKIYKFSFS